MEVLQLAATAHAEVAAARHDPLRALMPQRRHRCLFPVVLLAVHLRLNFFAGQRAFDEDHLALGVVGHALPFEVERLDLQPFTAGCHRPDYPAGHACRYSAQCGSAMPESVSRTNAISRSYSSSVKPQRIFWKRQYSK